MGFLGNLTIFFVWVEPVPVHVVLNGEGEGEVDDIVHVGDVQPAGRHISGHQQRDLPALELLHRHRPDRGTNLVTLALHKVGLRPPPPPPIQGKMKSVP